MITVDTSYSSRPLAYPDSTTKYILTIVDKDEMMVTDTVLLTVRTKPVLILTSTVQISEGDSIDIGGSPTASGGTGPLTYLWSPSDGLSSVTSSNPWAKPLESTFYSLEVTDGNGCKYSTEKNVLISKSYLCNCDNNNPCINGNVWYQPLSSNFYTPIDFVSSYTSSSYNNFKNFDGIVTINTIPYVKYGTNKFSSDDNQLVDGRYDMDIYFPGKFTSNNNENNHYPVLLFLPGGAFGSSDRTGNFAKQCDSLAARGFIVFAMSYRTDPNHAKCNDEAVNFLLVRAIQDARLALRTIRAIKDGKYNYKDDQDLDHPLSLPFIDTTRIIVGGTSAGSVTMLTTAYYDACDIQDALNRNNELKNKDLGSSDIVCSHISMTVPFALDESSSSTTGDEVQYYFDDVTYPTYRSAPMKRMIGVFNIKGGVPENGDDYCYTGCGGLNPLPGPKDPNLEKTRPQYVANHSSKPSDFIPMIGFQAVNDAVVPFLSNYEPTYILDCLCTEICDENQKTKDFCLSHFNGFLFGSGKIYSKLIYKNIPAQLYAEPGAKHDGFESDDYPFINTQTALFVSKLLCSYPPPTDFDSIIDFTVPNSSIGFASCNPITIHFKVKNTNAQAVITTIDITSAKVTETNAQGVKTTLYDQGSTVKTLYYTADQPKFYIEPGNTTSSYFNFDLNVSNFNSDPSFKHKISFTLQNPNGFSYKAFYGCGRDNKNELNFISVSKEATGGCFSNKIDESELNVQSKVLIFPNPTSTDFLTQGLPVKTQISITDLFGRQMEYFMSNGDQITFGSMYPPGVYLTRLIFTDGTTKIYKLMKIGK